MQTMDEVLKGLTAMATNESEQKLRGIVRQYLGAAVGNCIDIGYTKEHILRYTDALCDCIIEAKRKVHAGTPLSRVLEDLENTPGGMPDEMSPEAKRILGLDDDK